MLPGGYTATPAFPAVPFTSPKRLEQSEQFLGLLCLACNLLLGSLPWTRLGQEFGCWGLLGVDTGQGRG